MKSNIISKLSILPVMVSISMHVAALEKINDQNLSQVTGQDGIAITAEMDSATVENVTWSDGTEGSIQFNNTTVSNSNVGRPITVDMAIQTGSNTVNKPGLNAQIKLGSATVTVPQLSVCSGGVTPTCTKLGALSVSNNGSQTQFNLIANNGLFNKQGTAQLKAILDDLTLSFEQDQGGTKNQLILGDLYANMTADGQLYVTNAEGLKFFGKVSLDDKSFNGVKRKGLEVLVQHKTSTTQTQFGKLAVSGSVNDADFSLRGVKGTISGLGFDNGTAGIAMRAKGELASGSGSSAFKLQFGGADGDGMRIQKWQGYADNTVATFDTGNIYINVLPSGQTTKIPVNTQLTKNITQQSGIDFKNTLNASQPAILTGNVTPYRTVGGKVVDIQGNVVDLYRPYTYDVEDGLQDVDGNHQSVKRIKDGFVIQGGLKTDFGNGADGTFEQIYSVKEDGTTTPLIIGNRYDNNGGTNNTFANRGKRYVYVWRTGQGPNNLLPGINARNVIVASAESGGDNNNPGDRTAYQKAVFFYKNNANVLSAYNLSGDNLTNLNNGFSTVNKHGEARIGNGQLWLERHQFNNAGYLVRISDGSIVYEEGVNFAVVNNFVVKANTANQPIDADGNVTTDFSQMQALYELATPQEALATIQDFQLPATTEQTVSIMVRDAGLQGVPTETEFFSVNNLGQDTLKDTQKWALAPVLHGVNANILIKGKTLAASDAKVLSNFAGGSISKPLLLAGEAVQLDAVMSTTGRNAAGTKTTGLLVVDGDTKRYAGLRNLNTLVKASGTLQVNEHGIALDLPNTKIVMRGELATGTVASAPTATNASGRGAAGTSDRLLGAEARFVGDVSTLVTGSAKGFKANARLKIDSTANQGMMLSYALPDNSGRLLFDKISGTVDIKDMTIDNLMDSSGKGMLKVKQTLIVNPQNNITEDLRIRNLSFNATPADTSTEVFDTLNEVRLGEMALSKHQIYSEINIRGAQ